MRVALVTWCGAPGVDPDDRLLATALDARGVTAVPAIWSDPTVDWGSFDLVVIRSAWDYHRHLNEFLGWVGRVEMESRLWNRPSTVRWNSNKTYLRDLEARGLPVVPTVWGSGVASVAEVFREHDWQRLVLKPSVSADAENTYLLERKDTAENESRFSALRQRGEVLLQPFMAEVTTAGERSLVFVDGAYSHAALRPSRLAPAPDLRAGATVEPRPEELAVARHALATLPERTLYARVDLVTDPDGIPRLMELELIEPTLFLRTAPSAADRLAAAIASRGPEPGRGSVGRSAATNP